MDRKRGNGVLWEVAERFDLPGDMAAGLPHVEMLGDRELYVERHRGIVSYSGEAVDVNTAGGLLRIRGEGLTLLAMTAEAVRVGGRVAAVEWVI